MSFNLFLRDQSYNSEERGALLHTTSYHSYSKFKQIFHEVCFKKTYIREQMKQSK